MLQAFIHILRHTFATRLNEANLNAKAIQEILGHKDIQTTMDIYTDAMHCSDKRTHIQRQSYNSVFCHPDISVRKLIGIRNLFFIFYDCVQIIRRGVSAFYFNRHDLTIFLNDEIQFFLRGLIFVEV